MSRVLLLLFFILFVTPLTAATSPLAAHSSPYLAMHANDPVQWQLWGETVLQQAQREHRRIFISSGYFTCHWCHVMQQQSFSDRRIAAQLNRDYIPVMIDRELWPELDAYLIDFVRQTRGIAGWPLNVFLTPEGYPLVGITYVPPDEFSEFLQRLTKRWQNDAANLSSLARAAATVSVSASPTATLHLSATVLKEKLQQALLQRWDARADHFSGGFGSGAKFPQPPLLGNLMTLTEQPELEDFLQLTLDAMASHGLRDHLGGGFFRYTVDPGWQIPHFEKMLADNAQLASLYLKAADRFHNDTYRKIGLETLDFILNEMHHRDGGFIAALSSVDEHGVEGGYYLWTEQQLVHALDKKNADAAKLLLGMIGAPLSEHGYLPIPQTHLAGPMQRKLEALNATLLVHRERRTLPRDDKRLAGWNALVLSALSAAQDAGEQYRRAGLEVRDYLHSLWDGKRLWRMRDDKGQRRLAAGLGDYAYTALGLLQWDAAMGDRKSRHLAIELVGTAWQRFHNTDGWLPGGEAMLIGQRQKLLPGGALPSAAVALFEADLMLGEKGPIGRQAMEDALTAQPVAVLNSPLRYSSYLILLQHLLGE